MLALCNNNGHRGKIVMQNHWILDVLADMRSFAAANGLPVLAEHLAQTTVIATAEIADTRHRIPHVLPEDLDEQSAADAP